MNENNMPGGFDHREHNQNPQWREPGSQDAGFNGQRPNYDPYTGQPYEWQPPAPGPRQSIPADKREFVFAAVLFVFSVLCVNALLFGGLYLAFAFWSVCVLAASTVYLAGKGMKRSFYGLFCMAAAAALLASFAFSKDWSLEFGIALLAGVAWFLGLSQTMDAGVYNPGGFTGLADGLRVAFPLTYPKIGAAVRGLFRKQPKGRKKLGGALIGLLLALPLLCVLIPLLKESDAAFEGLMNTGFAAFSNIPELAVSVFFGILTFFPLYTRAVHLRGLASSGQRKVVKTGNFAPAVLAGFLGAIAFFYLLYLFSQLAYFFSAFSGLLPENFTPAEYARRGFFETATICAINLGIVAISAGNVAKREKVPGVIRLLCLFFCLFSLVLLASAFAKMAIYMGVFGLTRLRVLTSVFMLCLAVAIVAVAVWIFVPQFPYMKWIVATVLAVSCVVAWADVDTQVAKYNVTAYETGRLSQVDVANLEGLGSGAVPYLERLTHSGDPEVARRAENAMASQAESLFYIEKTAGGQYKLTSWNSDLRSWCYRENLARKVLEAWAETGPSALEPYCGGSWR